MNRPFGLTRRESYSIDSISRSGEPVIFASRSLVSSDSLIFFSLCLTAFYAANVVFINWSAGSNRLTDDLTISGN